MCVNCKQVYNEYSGRYVFVKCGHCPACQQEKANYRASRIRNTSNPKTLTNYFLTLTYDNKFIPYVLRKDLLSLCEGEIKHLNVYRDNEIRKIKGQTYIRKCLRPVCTLDSDMFTCFGVSRDPSYYAGEVQRLKGLRYRACNGSFSNDTDKIGVAYYKDIQDFAKRLRLSLQRKTGTLVPLQYFCCSEYGSRFARPHFHLQISAPSTLSHDLFKQAVDAAWPFDNHAARKCEIAGNVSSYIASYVNCHDYVPKVFRYNSEFRPRCSYSKGYGMENSNFSLDKILEFAQKCKFEYVANIIKAGTITPVSLSVPPYVISRYYPNFKGHSRLDNDSLIYVLSRHTYFSTRTALEEVSRKFDLRYTVDDLHKISVLIQNKQSIYGDKRPLQYAEDYLRVRSSYYAYLLPKAHQGVLPNECYDNVTFIDPNEFVFRKSQTERLNVQYDQKDKSHRLKNFVYTEINPYF